jgi:hypothetical protein
MIQRDVVINPFGSDFETVLVQLLNRGHLPHARDQKLEQLAFALR